jgi:hypothetical protein
MCNVFFEVQIEFLNITYTCFGFKGLNSGSKENIYEEKNMRQLFKRMNYMKPN